MSGGAGALTAFLGVDRSNKMDISSLPQGEKLTFRAVQENDLQILLEIQAQVTKSSLEAATAAFKRIRSYPNYTIYLAYLGDLPIGTFALLVMDNLGHMGCPIGIIENVVVDRKHRGLGFGKAMMKFAEALCREAKCYKVILGSNMKLEDAHRFYESIGFVKQGLVFSLEL